MKGVSKFSSQEGIKEKIIYTVNENLSLLEELPVAVYTCDMNGVVTFYNYAAAELWGQNLEIRKDFWFETWKLFKIDGSPLNIHESPMALAIKEQRSVSSEKIIIERFDGIQIHLLIYSKPIFNEQGAMTGTINTLVNVSENVEKDILIVDNGINNNAISDLLNKKVEQRTTALRKSEERYHKMIEEVEDYAILLLDKEGNILNWNRGAEKIKGYRDIEIIGKNFRIFYQDEDRKNKLPEQLIAQASQKGKAMHEGWRVKKNGDKFWGQIVITALHNQENDIIGFSKVTRDLTERKLAEDQAKSFTRDIEFRNKQLEEYAHIASHDLQEPLRKIMTFAQLLERNFDDKDIAMQYLEKMSASARRMTVLIKDVLQYSQLSLSDDLFVMTDLNVIIENLRNDYELLIEEKQVAISHSNLPVIKGIPIQLQQLFSNLFGNSLKFSSENPKIEIISEKASKEEIKLIAQLDSNVDYFKIIFKDNGIGFDPLFSDNVFKLFQRMHTMLPGTGIGLALCKKIVENHNGYINVNSEPNKGTIFTIFLPE